MESAFWVPVHFVIHNTTLGEQQAGANKQLEHLAICCLKCCSLCPLLISRKPCCLKEVKRMVMKKIFKLLAPMAKGRKNANIYGHLFKG